MFEYEVNLDRACGDSRRHAREGVQYVCVWVTSSAVLCRGIARAYAKTRVAHLPIRA